MLEKIRAYVDSFEYLTVLVDKSISYKDRIFYLVSDEEKIKLDIVIKMEEYSFYKFILKNIDDLKLHKEYYIEDQDGNRGFLQSGSVIRTKEFEARYKYDGPLGFQYSKDKTVFRVWSPVAKEIILELCNLKGAVRLFPFTYIDKGVWECVINTNIEGYKYLLQVRLNEEFKSISDPYALSSSANGKYNYVVDVNKFYKMKYQKPEFSGNYTDSIIYEASIRDFTYSLNNKLQGTFKGMIENNPTEINEPTGIEYIKSLGVTHLQLLPIFDFGGVDDIEKNSNYNWGYNPEQYFIPCGWYSINPDDPYSRINELLELIDNCHKIGLRVNMDVVFNHVFKFEEFPFDHLVPGYYYRVDDSGYMSNASFCGNDLATERYMCSRFVCDVLKYYALIFNISGFRFDLMGLLDINTLNHAHKMLLKIDKSIMLYGEGWNMKNPLNDELRPHMFNHYKIPQYAFFNDRFRDFIRGSQSNKSGGYSFNQNMSLFELRHLVLGSCLDYYKFNNPFQTINYVECHDNYTFFDYGKTVLRGTEEEILDASRLALEIILVSQGVPFIHAGEEFFRTKQGVENSYNTKDEINKIDYDRRDKYIDMVNTVRDLISIRKEYPCLRYFNKRDIEEKIHLLENLCNQNTLALYIEYEKGFYIVIKNDYKEVSINNKASVMIFDGFKKCNIKKSKYILNTPGVYLFKGE